MDPRIDPGPQARSANHSPLMQALQRRSMGAKINFCPYGCENKDLDDHGYCKHLVGFTTDRIDFEPRRYDDVWNRYIVDGSKKQPIQKTDHIERITSTYRVYRDVDGSGAKFKVAERLAEAAPSYERDLIVRLSKRLEELEVQLKTKQDIEPSKPAVPARQSSKVQV